MEAETSTRPGIPDESRRVAAPDRAETSDDGSSARLALLSPPAEPARFMAALHLQVLPVGFFGRLGQRFLSRYYETFMTSPHAVAVVALERDEPVGFVVGTLRPAEHLRWTLRHRGARLALGAAAALLVRPRLLLYFARTRAVRYGRAVVRHALRRRPTQAPAPVDHQPTTSVLWHIAVDPRTHGAGIGRLLVRAFVRRAVEAGRSRVVLVTRSDTGAGGFYENLGWHRVQTRQDEDGHTILTYEIAL